MKLPKTENRVLTLATVLMYSPLFTMALLYRPNDTSSNVEQNSTIAIGYYINQTGVPRAPVIGMAIDKATSEGLLPEFSYE